MVVSQEAICAPGITCSQRSEAILSECAECSSSLVLSSIIYCLVDILSLALTSFVIDGLNKMIIILFELCIISTLYWSLYMISLSQLTMRNVYLSDVATPGNHTLMYVETND